CINSGKTISAAQKELTKPLPYGFIRIGLARDRKELYKLIKSSVVSQPSSVNDLLEIVVKLIPSINNFFDKVMVMAEDKKVRENRLGLLQKIASLSNGIADLSKLEGF
ncbi:MAG: DALR anticodon-binding domain-containing protein, partial [Anaerolineales bacterium]